MKKTISRIVIGGACLLCGLLFLASGVMWVCSYTVPTASNTTRGCVSGPGNNVWRTWRFLSQRGGMAVGRITTTHPNVRVSFPATGICPDVSMLYRAHYQILALPAVSMEAGMDLRSGNPVRCLGFAGSWGSQATEFGSASYMWIGLPYWFVCLLTAPWPVIGVRRIWRRWRQLLRIEQGLCGRCGYDLRGSPGQCPECGEAGRVTVTVAR